MSAVEAMASRTDLRIEIAGEIRTILAESANRTSRPAPVDTLWDAIGTHVDGGKLLRPLLTVDTYDSLVVADGAAPERAIIVRTAAAIELLHFAFLLHDDVIDGDTVRRGRPNLIGDVAASAPARSSEHWGRTAGILAGDLVLSIVHQVIARLPIDARQRERLLDLLDDSIAESVAGEWLDVGLADGTVRPDLTTVLEMTTRKTTAYSFELPLRAAATLAGTPRDVEEALATAGRRLGLAFQLQDDLLSTFGNQEQHGKDERSDLRERKETALVAAARTTADWPEIDAAFTHAAASGDTDRLVALLDRCGARRFVETLVADELAALDTDISGGALPRSAADVIRRLRHELTGRIV